MGLKAANRVANLVENQLYILNHPWHNRGMKEEKCIIKANKNIRKRYYTMQLESEYISSHAAPGNFIMLAASRGLDPLLKRPFGILDVKPPYLWIYYETIGKGTEMISALKPGEWVNVVGPLGNAFPSFTNKNLLLVAGGRGIAPLYYACRNYAATNKVYLIYGAKSADDINLLEELQGMGLQEIYLYTDDGSLGKQGFVTADIGEIIASHQIAATISCGPEKMFASLFHTIGKLEIENYVSMEAMMGCGFGICYSCAVKGASGGYKKVCADGPVFKMEELVWEK